MTLTFGSVCSGIEAAGVAWAPLGWRAAFYAEIEPFPRAVLEHRFGAGSKNGPALHGDFTTIGADDYGTIDLLVGGTPCQSFSVAGLRKGLDDGRGNLALEFLKLARQKRPRWLVWENVPGVLSSNGGRDFGAVLGGMVELGYGVFYRVLDAQFVRVDGFPGAVAQRRRRVFVVGHLGDWRRAAAVLLERESLRRDSPPRRETGQGVAADLAPSLTASGRGVARSGESRGQDPLVAHALNAKGGSGRMDGESEIFIPAPNGSATVAHARRGETAPTLRAGGFDKSHANAGVMPAVADRYGVRRLTPRECERLQGFPDDFTRVPWRGKAAEQCPDGPRYKACGNAMAVNVMRWIGRRIEMVEAL